MIKKERLEELIEKGATIYFVGNQYWDNSGDWKVIGHKLTKTRIKDLGGIVEISSDKRFFETKEDAEFASKYQKISRIDYLNLPTYEEFIKNYQSFGDELITDEKCVIFTCKDGVYSLYACDNEIWVGKDADGSVMFHKELNRDNYIRACDICVRLFKGEI